MPLTLICRVSISASFHLLLAATPLYNLKNDFRGLSRFTFLSKNDNLYAELEKLINSNPFTVHDSDPAATLCLTSSAMGKFMYVAEPILAGKWLGQVWQHFMLRGLASCIPFAIGPQIGDAIPTIIQQLCVVHFLAADKVQYSLWVKQAMSYDPLGCGFV